MVSILKKSPCAKTHRANCLRYHLILLTYNQPHYIFTVLSGFSFYRKATPMLKFAKLLNINGSQPMTILSVWNKVTTKTHLHSFYVFITFICYHVFMNKSTKIKHHSSYLLKYMNYLLKSGCLGWHFLGKMLIW